MDGFGKWSQRFLILLAMVWAMTAVQGAENSLTVAKDSKGYMDAVAAARELIVNGKAECVLVRGAEIIARERGRGVSPLLRLFDRDPAAMCGATVVDKVIGRAAAFIAINGGATAVHGELLSAEARELLQKHAIAVSAGRTVPRILNRKLDGLCPLEASVQGIDDPAAALQSLRARIAELQKPATK